MTHTVTVVGLNTRGTLMFPSKWEAQEYATAIKEIHPHLNVFVAPVLPDPATVDWSQF